MYIPQELTCQKYTNAADLMISHSGLDVLKSLGKATFSCHLFQWSIFQTTAQSTNGVLCTDSEDVTITQDKRSCQQQKILG